MSEQSDARTKHGVRVFYGLGFMTIALVIVLLLDLLVEMLSPYVEPIVMVGATLAIIAMAYGFGVIVEVSLEEWRKA